MKFVVFNLETNSIGCNDTQCFILNDNCLNPDGSINEDYLDEYGNELARDNADMYGLLDCSEDESGIENTDIYYSTHEIVEYDSVEEAEEDYGAVLEF